MRGLGVAGRRPEPRGSVGIDLVEVASFSLVTQLAPEQAPVAMLSAEAGLLIPTR